MKQKSFLERASESIKTMPFFKRILDTAPNGAQIDAVKELTIEEIRDEANIVGTPDNTLDAISRVPDLDMIDKFSAIDRLNAAIAGIQYEKPVETPIQNEKPVEKVVESTKNA